MTMRDSCFRNIKKVFALAQSLPTKMAPDIGSRTRAQLLKRQCYFKCSLAWLFFCIYICFLRVCVRIVDGARLLVDRTQYWWHGGKEGGSVIAKCEKTYQSCGLVSPLLWRFKPDLAGPRRNRQSFLIAFFNIACLFFLGRKMKHYRDCKIIVRLVNIGLSTIRWGSYLWIGPFCFTKHFFCEISIII